MKKLLLVALSFSFPAVAMQPNKKNNDTQQEVIDFKKLSVHEYYDRLDKSTCFDFLQENELVARSKYCVYEDRDGASLERLEVATPYRKQGIGSKLLRYTLKQIITDHPSVTEASWSVTLLDDSTNLEKLCAFYKKKIGAEITTFNKKSPLAKLNLSDYKARQVQFDKLTKKSPENSDQGSQLFSYYFSQGLMPVADYTYKIDTKKPTEADLRIITVDSLYRDQGIGTELFRDFMQEIIEKHPSVTLVTWFATPLDSEMSFEQLCSFYRKFGATVDDSGCAYLDIKTYKKKLQDL